MDNRTAGLLGLGIVGLGGAMKWRDYRSGFANLVIGRANTAAQVRRDISPGLFWTITALNAVLMGIILVASIIGIIWP